MPHLLAVPALHLGDVKLLMLFLLAVCATGTRLLAVTTTDTLVLAGLSL